MRYQRGAIAITLTAAAVMSLCGLTLMHVTLSHETHYTRHLGQGAYVIEYRMDFFKQFFREPYEILIFFFNKQPHYGFTTQEAFLVRYSAPQIEAFFKKHDKDIENCWLIIHPHFPPVDFSEGDKRVEQYFRSLGFEGLFAIYFPHNGEIQWSGQQ